MLVLSTAGRLGDAPLAPLENQLDVELRDLAENIDSLTDTDVG